MAKVTWKGESGGPDGIEQFGLKFPKGEAVTVPDDHRHLAKFRGNPQFAVEDGAQELSSEADDEPPYKAVHKGRGVYAVAGPEGVPDAGPFDKATAKAEAARLNAEAASEA